MASPCWSFDPVVAANARSLHIERKNLGLLGALETFFGLELQQRRGEGSAASGDGTTGDRRSSSARSALRLRPARDLPVEEAKNLREMTSK
jgi:hypothetical protein